MDKMVLTLAFACWLGFQAHGQANEGAPAYTSDTLIINRPIAEVWQMLTDIGGWPGRFPFIMSSERPTNLQPGAKFRWQTQRLRLLSTITLNNGSNRFAWQGGKLGVRVRHEWQLDSLPNQQTRLISRESQQGWYPALFPKRAKASLKAGNLKWLNLFQLNSAVRHG